MLRGVTKEAATAPKRSKSGAPRSTRTETSARAEETKGLANHAKSRRMFSRTSGQSPVTATFRPWHSSAKEVPAASVVATGATIPAPADEAGAGGVGHYAADGATRVGAS